MMGMKTGDREMMIEHHKEIEQKSYHMSSKLLGIGIAQFLLLLVKLVEKDTYFKKK